MRLELNYSKHGSRPKHRIFFYKEDIVNYTSTFHGHRDICIYYFLDDNIYNLIKDKGDIPHSHGEIEAIFSAKDKSMDRLEKVTSGGYSFIFELNTEDEEEAKQIFTKLLMFKK